MKPFNQLFTQSRIFWICWGILLIPNLFLCFTEQLPLLFKVAYLLIPGALYLLLMGISSKPGSIFWWLLPLHFIGALQLVLLYLFGNSVIASDMFLNIFTTNSGEAIELLNQLTPAIIGVCILYIPALALASYSIKREERLSALFRKQTHIWSGILLIAGIAAFIPAHNSAPWIARAGNLYPFNVFNNARFALTVWEDSQNYPKSSQNFDYQAKSTHPKSQPEVYIFVIGETSRANNWGLYGYERNTTSRLSALTDLYHFDNVITEINATHKSVPLMLCPADALNFNEIYRQKSLISAFRQAGFHTAFLSNQLRNGSFTEFFANETHFTHYAQAHLYDEEMLPLVDSILNMNNTKQLILLHTYGSHFNYCERYPDDCRLFTPDRINGIEIKNRQAMVNAYDNSIVATDKLLDAIIERLRNTHKSAAMLYISDHGEDLLDDDRHRFLHASPLPTYYQLHVPCLLWFSEKYACQHPQYCQLAKARQDTPFDSRVIFHTLLNLGGIDTRFRDNTQSIIHPSFQPGERYYLGEQNRAIPLCQLPLDEEDLQAFEQQGIAIR